VSRTTISKAAPDRRVFRRIRQYRGSEIDISAWPATVSAVAQILRCGLELPAGVTVLTGENGSGKSTVVGVIEEACGPTRRAARPRLPFLLILWGFRGARDVAGRSRRNADNRSFDWPAVWCGRARGGEGVSAVGSWAV
jgi:hypothetical protein